MDYTDTYDPERDFDRHYSLASVARIREYVRPGDRVLELGCATGLMTEQFAAAGASVVAVDRSEPYLERVRGKRLPGVQLIRADLQALPQTGEHEHVVIANVLHEVGDPVAVLRHAAARLAPAGLVHATLQNPRSIHRLAALELGLIDTLTQVAQRGEQFGTQRLYDADQLAELGRDAGLVEVRREGVLLKPLPNAEMERLSGQALAGMAAVARHFPQHCAINYLVFRRV